MKKLLTIATVTASMFLAGCQSAMMTKPTTTLADGSVVEPKGSPMRWEPFCQVGSNRYINTSKTITLKSRKNDCESRGKPKPKWEKQSEQRNEITTRKFSAFTTDNFVFEADISIDKKDDIGTWMAIYQIHGGSDGYTNVRIGDGTIRIHGGYNTVGKGKTNFVIKGAVTDKPERYLGDPFVTREPYGIFDWKTDGTVYNLRVETDLDGTGGFWITVFVDGKEIVKGYRNEKFTKGVYRQAKHYFHKTGLYSYNWIDYVMKIDNLKVRRIKDDK